MGRKLGDQNIDWEAAPPKGHVFIDICDGVEGPSVCIGNNLTGSRVAGPKPWGGGRNIHRFTASLENLRAALEAYDE